MIGSRYRVPDDMLPLREHLSPAEQEKWVCKWRRLVWRSGSYRALHIGVFVGACGFFARFMPPWEIADKLTSKSLFGAGELLVAFILAEFMSYAFSVRTIRRRIEAAHPMLKKA